MESIKKYSIYKLICSETNKIYIGSTAYPLYKRKWNHNSCYNKTASKPFVNPKMELLEEIETNDIITVLNREKALIKIGRLLNKNLIVNKNLPNRKADEYYVDCHDIILSKKKKYYLKNKEDIKLKRLLHYYRNHDIDKIKNKKIKLMLLKEKVNNINIQIAELSADASH
tara:strand:- start:5050 stop:5559 length:510 start_codon:yes stop_codon:yes gene_type:complete